MFDSLDEQMKRDEKRVTSSTDRLMRWGIMIVVAAIVFVALIVGVHLMS